MSSRTDKWGTPTDVFKRLDEKFHFDVDVCADETNHKCEVYFNEEQDGLKQDWTKYNSVYMNPPYGRHMYAWMEKIYKTSREGGGTCVCCIPCRTDAKWMYFVMMASEVWLIKGRLHYNDSKDGAPFPSCIVIYRPKEDYTKPPIFHWVNQDMEIII